MPLTPWRALVVDDEPPLRMLVSRSLKIQQIACDQAEDGAAALIKLDENPYDILITDLRMPNRHGHSLCQAILERQDRPLVVVITGLAEPRLVADLKARGVDAIFQKPIDFPSFGGKIREMLDNGSAKFKAAPDDLSALVLEADDPSRSPTVVVLMHDRARSQRLSLELGTVKVDVFATQTTDALYRFVEEHRVDVMLIENVQFGFLRGAEILSRVQSLPSPPQAIVIGNAETFHPEQLRSLKIWKFVPPEATDSDLVQSVRNALFNMERTAELSPEARALAKSHGALPRSLAVLMRLAQYLQMPPDDISVEKLTKDLLTDAATTGELLRLANGSSSGARRRITNIAEALDFLGTTRAVLLLLSTGIRAAEEKLLSQFPENLRNWYQVRTALIGTVASVFAEQYFELSGETAFLLGLFQEMGILVMGGAFGEKYVGLVNRVRLTGPLRLHAIELQYFHVDHAEVSAALLELWRLPETLMRPVRHHHDSNLRIGDKPGLMAYVQPMRIAEAFADLWDNRHPARKDALERLVADCPRVKSIDVQDLFALSVRKLGEVAELYSLPVPDENAVLQFCRNVLAVKGVAGTDPAVAEFSS